MYVTETTPRSSSSIPFETTLSRHRARGLNLVVDFLQNKAIRSPRTAVAYSFALDYFDKYIQQEYRHKYNIETILERLARGQEERQRGSRRKQNNYDVYRVLNGFVSHLRNYAQNGHDLSSISVKLYMTALKSYLLYNDIEILPNKFKN
jgi:hypothetical protein